MKKLLGVLAVLTLSGTSAMGVVSCSQKPDDGGNQIDPTSVGQDIKNSLQNDLQTYFANLFKTKAGADSSGYSPVVTANKVTMGEGTTSFLKSISTKFKPSSSGYFTDELLDTFKTFVKDVYKNLAVDIHNGTDFTDIQDYFKGIDPSSIFQFSDLKVKKETMYWNPNTQDFWNQGNADNRLSFYPKPFTDDEVSRQTFVDDYKKMMVEQGNVNGGQLTDLYSLVVSGTVKINFAINGKRYNTSTTLNNTRTYLVNDNADKTLISLLTKKASDVADKAKNLTLMYEAKDSNFNLESQSQVLKTTLTDQLKKMLKDKLGPNSKVNIFNSEIITSKSIKDNKDNAGRLIDATNTINDFGDKAGVLDYTFDHLGLDIFNPYVSTKTSAELSQLVNNDLTNAFGQHTSQVTLSSIAANKSFTQTQAGQFQWSPSEVDPAWSGDSIDQNVVTGQLHLLDWSVNNGAGPGDWYIPFVVRYPNSLSSYAKPLSDSLGTIFGSESKLWNNFRVNGLGVSGLGQGLHFNQLILKISPDRFKNEIKDSNSQLTFIQLMQEIFTTSVKNSPQIGDVNPLSTLKLTPTPASFYSTTLSYIYNVASANQYIQKFLGYLTTLTRGFIAYNETNVTYFPPINTTSKIAFFESIKNFAPQLAMNLNGFSFTLKDTTHAFETFSSVTTDRF